MGLWTGIVYFAGRKETRRVALSKDILIQYSDMKEEIKDLHRRIEQLKRELYKMEEDGTVKDTVTGGMGGTQHFVVEGLPAPALRRKALQIKARKEKAAKMEGELLELVCQVEDYINGIEKSEIRIMFRFYYIDNLTWAQVAMQMNEMFTRRRIAYTEDNCKQRHKRFLEKAS